MRLLPTALGHLAGVEQGQGLMLTLRISDRQGAIAIRTWMTLGWNAGYLTRCKRERREWQASDLVQAVVPVCC